MIYDEKRWIYDEKHDGFYAENHDCCLVVELSVGVGNALLGSPDQALASLQSTLEHASALLRRPVRFDREKHERF